MPRIAAALGVLATVVFSIGFNIHRYPVVWQSVAPGPYVSIETDQATVAQPLEAIAGAIRSAAARPIARSKGFPQPIPLPQAAGSPGPIPAPKPAVAESSKPPAPDAVVAGTAAKYAGAAEAARSPAEDKAKAPAAAKTAEATKKPKPNGKPKPIADTNKPIADTNNPVADNKKPSAAKPKGQSAKTPNAAKKSDVAAATPDESNPALETAKAEAPKPETPRAEVAAAPEPAVVESPLVPVRRDANQQAAAGVPGWNTSRSPWTQAAPDARVRRLPPVDDGQRPSGNPYAANTQRIPFYPTTGM